MAPWPLWVVLLGPFPVYTEGVLRTPSHTCLVECPALFSLPRLPGCPLLFISPEASPGLLAHLPSQSFPPDPRICQWLQVPPQTSGPPWTPPSPHPYGLTPPPHHGTPDKPPSCLDPCSLSLCLSLSPSPSQLLPKALPWSSASSSSFLWVPTWFCLNTSWV